MKKCVAVLLLFAFSLSLCSCGQGPRSGTVGNFSVSVYAGGERIPVKTAMGAAHENGLFADGMIAFMGAPTYALSEGKNIPVYSLTEDFACRAVAEKPYKSFSASFRVYPDPEGNPDLRSEIKSVETPEKGSFLVRDWSELEDGLYLVEVHCGITNKDFYKYGSGLFWLAVGEQTALLYSSTEPVVTAYQKEGDYTDHLGNSYHYLYRIPAFTGIGGDQARLNTEISDFVMSLIRTDLECVEENKGFSLVTYNADYEYHVNKAIVSLLCTVRNDWGDTRYLAVNTDTAGHALSRDNLLAILHIAEFDFSWRAKDALRTFFRETQSDIPESLLEWADEQNAKTLSDENLQDTQLFLNEEGRLCMVVRVYSLAGADWYWRIIEL